MLLEAPLHKSSTSHMSSYYTDWNRLMSYWQLQVELRGQTKKENTGQYRNFKIGTIQWFEATRRERMWSRRGLEQESIFPLEKLADALRNSRKDIILTQVKSLSSSWGRPSVTSWSREFLKSQASGNGENTARLWWKCWKSGELVAVDLKPCLGSWVYRS